MQSYYNRFPPIKAIDPKAAMSGHRAPTSSRMPAQPQPFRFWLPFRSNAGSWRQQPRPPSSRPMPSSPQPPPPPPPTPAAPSRSPAHAVEEDIHIQSESSDESDTIPVESSDSSQLRGRGGPSMADLELTLSGAPATSHEQSLGRDGNRSNDTKIAISGFPRSRLFDGARAPYRQEIEDGLKSLGAGRGTPAPRPESGSGYRVITLAGHNIGSSMVVGSGGPREAQAEATTPRAAEPEDPGSAARPPAVSANVNSNVQNVNNSSIEGSTCSTGNPGVHVDIKSAREESPPPREDEKPKEPKKRPPLVVPATAPERSTEPSAAAAPAKARPRRCLRSLMMENGSDTEAARKPKPSACKFQCVSDHKPSAAARNGGGTGGRNAEDGGKSSTKEAN